MSDHKRTSNPGAPRGLRDRAGQALAEMVLVTPILLLLVFGIIEFGLAFRTHQIITNSAREGARSAVIPSTTTNEQIEDIVRQRLESAGLDITEPEPLAITLRCDGVEDAFCSSSGQEWDVEVRYCQRFFVLGPLINAVADNPCSTFGTVQLRTVSTMRNE